MNKLTIIGNLTRNPEIRTTQNGIQVATFSVAVNRRKSGEEQKTDYFRVTAWRGLADVCGRYLQKGHKVAVTGPVGIEEWTGQDGQHRAALALTAEDLEMLTSKAEAEKGAHEGWQDQKEAAYRKEEREAIQNEPRGGFVQVDDEELPF